MNTCIYCSNFFENAPGEHLLQNFLGARKTSSEIVCDKCQALFGQTIDSALEKGLQPIRNIFGTEGGRGDPGPTIKKLSTSGPKVIDFEPGAQPRLNEPVVEVSPRIDGKSFDIHVELSNLKQLGWAMKKIRDSIPGYVPTEDFLRSIAQPQQANLEDFVKLKLTLGGRDYFRGLLKSTFNYFAFAFRSEAGQPAFDPVREFIRNGTGEIADFGRWTSTDAELPIPRLGTADQAIVIRTNGSSVEGVVQLFGDIVHPVRLSDTYSGVPLICSYFVDPFHEANPDFLLNPAFDAGVLMEFNNQSPTNNTAVQKAMHARLLRILAQYSDREIQRVLIESARE